VFGACKSQGNTINYGASAMHSLCFLAVFMLAMLFGSQRVLVRVFILLHIKVNTRFVFNEGGIIYFMLCFFKQHFPCLFFPHLFQLYPFTAFFLNFSFLCSFPLHTSAKASCIFEYFSLLSLPWSQRFAAANPYNVWTKLAIFFVHIKTVCL